MSCRISVYFLLFLALVLPLVELFSKVIEGAFVVNPDWFGKDQKLKGYSISYN
jgi:hypothetical protein